MERRNLGLLAFAIILTLGVVLVLSDIYAQSDGAGTLLQGVKTDKTDYKLGETVEFTYAVKNRSNQPITYNFSSGKQFDLWITRMGTEFFRLSKNRVYTQALTTLTLQPGETKSFTVTWNQADDNGQQVGPGTYTVTAQLTPLGQAPPATTAKVQIGTAAVALVPVTVSDAIKNYNTLQGKTVGLQGTYRGWSTDARDPNIKSGPPVTKSDWIICDNTGCMYVTGRIDLDPVEDVGRNISVTGKLKKTDTGQVYLAASGARVSE